MRVRTLAVLVGVFQASAAPGAEPPAAPQLLLVRQHPTPVLTTRSPGAEGIRYGFEGGRVVKVRGTYHLFTSEMVGDPIWVKMRLGHWTSRDRLTWKRASTVAESSGEFEGKDPRASLWSPLPVWDEGDKRWNLFYVAYRSAPSDGTRFLLNHAGEIWRAVSRTPGEEGIRGPFEDVGVVMRPGADSLPWEGLQGTDSFFPWPVGRPWRAFYGSARTETKPIGHWLVGPAEAENLSGPWRRVRKDNPAPLETRFIENPIVPRLRGAAPSSSTTARARTWSAGRTLPTACAGARGSGCASNRGRASGRKTCARRSAWCTKAATASASSIPASSRLPTGRACSTRRKARRPAPSGSSSCGCSV